MHGAPEPSREQRLRADEFAAHWNALTDAPLDWSPAAVEADVRAVTAAFGLPAKQCVVGPSPVAAELAKALLANDRQRLAQVRERLRADAGQPAAAIEAAADAAVRGKRHDPSADIMGMHWVQAVGGRILHDALTASRALDRVPYRLGLHRFQTRFDFNWGRIPPASAGLLAAVRLVNWPREGWKPTTLWGRFMAAYVTAAVAVCVLAIAARTNMEGRFNVAVLAAGVAVGVAAFAILQGRDAPLPKIAECHSLDRALAAMAATYAADHVGAARMFALARLAARLERAEGCVETPRTLLVSAPPTRFETDAAGRPHSLHCPAIAYADGLAFWALGGVIVDEQLVLRPETQSVEQIDGEQNEEVRRLRIERFAGAGTPTSAGWMKYLAAVGAEALDEHRNDVEGTREALFSTARGERLLVCHCPSTARVYALEMPAEIATCAEAQQWLWAGSLLASELGKPFNVIGRT